jgi:hypothetical protein
VNCADQEVANTTNEDHRRDCPHDQEYGHARSPQLPINFNVIKCRLFLIENADWLTARD